MIYVFDLVFAFCYLLLRQLMLCAHDNNLPIYMELRHIAVWVEYLLILLFFYAAPEHTVSEAGVSFFMCSLSKLAFDYIVKKIKNI
jgi:hypothetical protein